MPIISLQISDDLLERFEKVRNQSGFNSKSEALRDSIVNFIEKNENFDNLEGYKIMTISLVYPFKEVTINQISDLYSRFHQIIKTITDWRIVEKKIEIVLLVGEVEIIKDLYRELAKIKDVICSIREIIID
ncbi:MAG: ribbon-helix-helix protein, CopG family [Candidatus Lokiarchaeota archaeon]|nr:ribbon-helix-helix protein, CopG family [Candidatus Lokiarchaeota archaeon]